MRTIVSWDVGVVHLGLCILREREDAVPEILHWDNINLMQDDESHSRCGESTRNGQCKAKAGWVLRAPGGPYYCCGRHKTACENRWEGETESLFRPTTHRRHCVGKRRNGDSCASPAKWKGPHGYYCTMHCRRARDQAEKDCQLQPIPKKKTMKLPIYTLQTMLMEKLDSLLPVMVEHGVTHCYIENQPSKLAGTMKGIGTTIAAWFLLRGKIDHWQGWQLESVQHVNACNKIKLASEEGQTRVRRAGKGEKYKLTKKLAVEYTRELLADQPHWLAVLEGFQKKDDPCDALLQGLYILSQ